MDRLPRLRTWFDAVGPPRRHDPETRQANASMGRDFVVISEQDNPAVKD
jgi:hypothetical protein